MTDFIIKHQPMICGSYDAEVRIYNKYIGRSGKIWLVANQEAAAENVYVEGGKNSDGFGGRVLQFHLTNGTVLNLQGPWHSNADALYADTGVDVRNQHYIFGVIGTGREDNPERITGVIYQDEQPMLGSFNRIHDLAEQLSKERDEVLYYYSQSRGGSSCGPTKNYREKSKTRNN